MQLFYNPSWFKTEDHLTLFLTRVPNPSNINTWNDLEPYLNSEIAALVEMEDIKKPKTGLPHSLRLIEDPLHPDLLPGILDWENPNPKIMANVILDYALYQNKIWELKQRIKEDEFKPPQFFYNELRDIYNERSLGSIVELL